MVVAGRRVEAGGRALADALAVVPEAARGVDFWVTVSLGPSPVVSLAVVRVVVARKAPEAGVEAGVLNTALVGAGLVTCCLRWGPRPPSRDDVRPPAGVYPV